MGILSFIVRHPHRLATAALVFGFFVDLFTFRSISLFWSIAILSVHLGIVAISILILATSLRGDSWQGRVRALVPIIHQYSTGSLLSAFLVLYSASGSLAESWPFLLLVAVAAVGNETLRLEKYRLPFQTTLFFLNMFLFAALVVPVFLDRIGATTFIVSASIAVGMFVVFVRLGRVLTRTAFKRASAAIRIGWISVVGLMFFLYFTNLIPPIPLSLKEIGIYHAVEQRPGGYIVSGESKSFFERWLPIRQETVSLGEGARAYVFTAVFAPANLETDVLHRWERFDEGGTWNTVHTVQFPIVGGRDGGYRGYSFTEAPEPGRWRVSVETTRGQVIGRTFFVLERAAEPVDLVRTEK